MSRPGQALELGLTRPPYADFVVLHDGSFMDTFSETQEGCELRELKDMKIYLDIYDESR
jgi:hypothetical protein